VGHFVAGASLHAPVTPAIVKLVNFVQHYAWGSHDAIARLQGREAPTTDPEAELWIGDHPVLPSCVVGADAARDGASDGTTSLPEWIARDAAGVLGPGAEHLPFLVKVLAAKSSLSVQVHPDAAQARSGFARESEAGIAEPERCYRDASAKHELLIALAAFEALAGFREDVATAQLVARLPGNAVETLLRQAQADPVPLAVALFHRLQRTPERETRALVSDLEAWAGSSASWEARTILRLLEEHPGDPLAIVPLLLNPVLLEPGEALVIRCGIVHTYLSGTAVEVMTRSDNVVRGGLTAKHREPGELQAVTLPRAIAAETLVARPCGAGVASYETGTDEFAVRTIELDGQTSDRPGGAVAIVLCTQGRVEVGPLAGSAGAIVALGSGEAALVPAGLQGYRLSGRAPASKAFEVSTR
jgi:mannose-6-phosphate isomerase